MSTFPFKRALFPALCASLFMFAQEPTVQLEPLIVTGTPGQRAISGTTATVNLVEQEEIQLADAHYVGDMLQYFPGVSVRNEGVFGRQGIEIRGLGANCRRIQILVDGRPEKMSLMGCSVTQTLPLSNVGRIELARGPEAVLYGSDAMGGVVNIITKKRETEGFETEWLESYSSHATIHTQLGHGGKIGNFDYYLTYDAKQSNGSRPNSHYDSEFASIRLGYQLDQVWRADFTSQFFNDCSENPGPDYNPASHDDYQIYRRWFWNATLKAEWDNADFSLSVFQNYGRHRFDMPTYKDFWASKDYTFGISAKYTRTLLEAQSVKDVLTLGYDFERQWAKPLDSYTDTITVARPFYNFGSFSTNSHQLFFYNELTLGDVIQTAGLRAHWDDMRQDMEWLPQVGIAWKTTDATTLKAKVSKGFRLPRFSETYHFPAHVEDLEPEEIWNYEIGIQHQIVKHKLNVAATFFYMDVKDQIRTVARPGQMPAKINVNANPYIIKGFEGELTWKPVKNAKITASYTLTDVQETGERHANRDGVPRHAIATVASYTWNNLTATFQCRYTDGLYASNQIDTERIEPLKDALVANVSLSYKVNKHLRVFCGINNLFDADYQEYNGYDADGISAHAGFHLTF